MDELASIGAAVAGCERCAQAAPPPDTSEAADWLGDAERSFLLCPDCATPDGIQQAEDQMRRDALEAEALESFDMDAVVFPGGVAKLLGDCKRDDLAAVAASAVRSAGRREASGRWTEARADHLS